MPAADAWDPGHAAVWVERAPGETRAIALRHPTYPYEADASADDSDTLIGIAAGYLRKVGDGFGLPNLLDPHTPTFNPPLAWLPLHGDSTAAPPLASFWVRRYGPDQGLKDRTAVILAVQSATANDPTRAIGSRLGIRIVAHVSPNGPPFKVQITSSACSTGLAEALGPSVRAAAKFFDEFFTQDEFRSNLRAGLQAAMGLDPDTVLSFDGLRVVGTSGEQATLEVYASASPPRDRIEAPAHAARYESPPAPRPDIPAYAVTARLVLDPSSDRPRLLRIDKQPLIAHATQARPVRARLFRRDPASQAGVGSLVDARPNRSPDRLRPYRRTVTLPGLTLGIFLNTDLHDNLDLDQVLVTRSRLVEANANETLAQTVFPICVTHPRLNWFAALSGYQRARRLWDTMRAFGLDPIQYSRFALFPLRIRYRATLTRGPGKDGKIVNAQVNFDPPERDLIGTQSIAPKPIQVRFALADVKRSASRREPLGLAADPRWSWHEYGHVLLVASTGALQFLFAHSPGDALAAILSDPGSALATHVTDRRLRGLTFPWVYLNRRHDRDVFLGWSWSGRYHRPADFPAAFNTYRRKGYQSEQILSSSLFRLYRSLGGDTVRADGTTPARRRRAAAAHYTAYLIMKAIGLMNPWFLLPLETPDQLVTLLMAADASTAPVAAGPLRGRVGGCALNVVRWAFEAQGLYATNDPLAVVDGPGLPPPQDVFIDDGRPDSPGAFPRGGYMPVSLDWHAAPNPSPWHASANAIRVVGNGVSVEVHNRGPVTAQQVTVQIWWIDWPLGQPAPPRWDKTAWNFLLVSASQSVPGGSAPVTFGPFALPAQPSGQRLLIVAEATCPGDPAITATGLPCATEPTRLTQLIAGDNNLGLRLHVVP